MDQELRSTIELNDKQINVLEWVKQGCPDGVLAEDNYSHRVSAKALQSRGLLRVSGHGKTWRAEVTERGNVWPASTEEDAAVRQRWEKNAQAEAATRDSKVANKIRTQRAQKATRASVPKPPSTSVLRRQRVDELTRQVIAAGGHLTIPAGDWKHDEAQWMERAAVHSPDRPRGQVLRVQPRGFGDNATAELSFEPYFRDLVEEIPVTVPDKVARYHQVAREFLDDKNSQYVTKEHVSRAARILHTITVEGERRGLTVLSRSEAIKKLRSDRRDWRQRTNLCFETEHGDYGFEIWETGGESDERINWDQRESRIRRGTPAWMLNGYAVFKGTGKLNMRQGAPPSSYGSPTFGDRKIVRLEDRITEAFIRFEMWQLEWVHRKEQWRIEKERRQRAWENAMANAKVAYAAQARWDYFMSLVKETERLERYEHFLERAKQQAESLPTEQRLIAVGFLSEVEERLRGNNPLLAPERLVPESKEPKPDDLEPFLRGWSPYGPGR